MTNEIEQAAIARDRAMSVAGCPECSSTFVVMNERWKLPGEFPYRGYHMQCYSCGHKGAEGTAVDAATWPAPAEPRP